MTKPRYSMDLQKHNELFELVEDTVSHFCNENMVSGELAWLIVETIAESKIAELRGELSL